jgi:16S rRNA (cytosine967-C5)-methyltransferase
VADPRPPRPSGQGDRGDASAAAGDGRGDRGDASAAAGGERGGRGDASAAAGGGRGGPPPADSGRALAHRVLRRVASEDSFATLALGAALASSGLDLRERRLATELVYGVLRHQPRLDRALTAMTPRGLGKLNLAVLTILRVAAYELLFLDRIPAHAAVSSAVGAVRRLGGQRLAGFANGVLRRLAREGEPALPPATDLRAHVEVACSLPRWIVDRLAAEVGEASLAEAAAALNEPAPLTLRVQRLRIDRDALLARLRAEHPEATLAASPWAPQAILAHGLGDPERSSAFAEGLFTVQDVGAQLVGHLVAPAPGWRILDACAGLGGKSTHLAELADDRAIIDAADLSRAKLRLGADTAARLGLTSVRTAPPIDLLLDPASDASRAAGLADAYDAVLLDAPCTGLGVLRRHPEAKLRLGEADIGRMSALQAQLLDAVASRVRPGGILVYSVCTFTHAEGPGQIEQFLARHPAFALEPTADGPAAALGASFHVWPHRHGADAFFLARLRRRP